MKGGTRWAPGNAARLTLLQDAPAQLLLARQDCLNNLALASIAISFILQPLASLSIYQRGAAPGLLALSSSPLH